MPQKPEALRKTFADWLTSANNPRFATAIANRTWQRIFGLAVQEPVTDIDDLSKGANPPLLAHLTDEMKRVNFDLREFQRIVFNTQAYQRQASVTPDLGKGPYLFPGPLLRRMTAEQAWDSVLTLVVGPELDKFKLRRADEITRMNIPGPVNQEVSPRQGEGDHRRRGFRRWSQSRREKAAARSAWAVSTRRITTASRRPALKT